MRSFGDTVNRFRPPANRPRPRVLAALVPHLAAAPGGTVREGLLRAPPRGRTPPPCLSAVEAAGPDRILAERGWENPALLARAAAARRALAAARVGGAWWHGRVAGTLPAGGGHAVVALAEPPQGEPAAPPDEAAACAMLAATLAQSPAERVVVLAPQAAAPGRRLRAELHAAAARGAAVVAGGCDPWTVLDGARAVYSIGGEVGFLALIAGIPVGAFGASFYTGWGATEDAPGVPRRGFARSVDEIFAGACLLATHCRDPFRDVPCGFEEALAILAEWRRIDEANRGIAACVGMSFWKHRRVADFVRSSAGVPAFRRSVAGALAAAAAPAPGSAAPRAIAAWNSRLPAGLAAAARRRNVPLIRVEDGFVRSVGLGSDFLPPASLVFDRRGMYYDPRGDSDLEALLRETAFAPALLARAERLTAQLVARGVTKYNLAGGAPPPQLPSDRRRILVPGQVEDDLSLVYGAARPRSNLGLLAQVRVENPDAFILYKPHPDVLAGHRAGAVPEGAARRFADLVVRGGSTASLLALADELHTMTSLAGFEALLRGRRVVVYGRPFYAGWGLTEDRQPCDRGRRLSLAELVAGALILYPRYLDPLTRLPCGPEIVIERLDDAALWRPGPLVLARRLQGALARRLGELWVAFAGAAAAPRRERPPA